MILKLIIITWEILKIYGNNKNISIILITATDPKIILKNIPCFHMKVKK